MKLILVTGANKGIGYEIVNQLDKLGYTVILCSRVLSKGIVASKSLSDNVIVKQLDVRDQKSIDDLFNDVKSEYGKLDILINNAGIGVGEKGVVDADFDEVNDILQTNLIGAWRVTKSMIPLLKKSEDGRIINMSSGLGELSGMTGGYAGYRVSKSSLNVLTMLFSAELQQFGIKVNSMCPGWVKTDMGGPNAPGTVEQGADTAVWLATTDNIATGKFFRNRKEINW